MYVDLDFFLVQENVYPNPLAMLICESSCSAVKCWYLLLGGSRSPGKDGVQWNNWTILTHFSYFFDETIAKKQGELLVHFRL